MINTIVRPFVAVLIIACTTSGIVFAQKEYFARKDSLIIGFLIDHHQFAKNTREFGYTYYRHRYAVKEIYCEPYNEHGNLSVYRFWSYRTHAKTFSIVMYNNQSLFLGDTNYLDKLGELYSFMKSNESSSNDIANNRLNTILKELVYVYEHNLETGTYRVREYVIETPITIEDNN
jgi:hypothetical protein